MSDKAEYVLVLGGSTQVGKDSFINTLFGCQTANEGLPLGQSTTVYPQIYRLELNDCILVLINVPGWQETTALRSDKVLKNLILNFILGDTNISDINGFLLFDSMSDSSTQVTNNILRFQEMFPTMQASGIIIVTKIDQAKQLVVSIDGSTQFGIKKPKFQEEGQQRGMPVLFWENFTSFKPISPELRQQQLNELLYYLKQRTPYHLSKVQETRNAINQKAQQLMNEYPPEYQDVEVEYEVDEPIENQRQIPIYGTQTICIKGGRKLGIGKHKKTYIDQPVIIRYDTVKEVVGYNKVKKTKPERIEKEKDFNKFLAQAKKEFMEQLRNEISN